MTSKKQSYWPALKKVALALDLPEVEEATSYRQPCLKAYKKLWVWCSPHADAFVFRVRVDERDMLISAEPDRYFTTDHYRGYDLVLVHPDKFDPNWVQSNLKRVWGEQAGQKQEI